MATKKPSQFGLSLLFWLLVRQQLLSFQQKTGQPQIHVSGEVSDHACDNQGQGAPVRDATGAQVI